MQPAVPDEPGPRRSGRPGEDGQWLSADDVGAFSQGSAFSRWALARYLVGRAIGSSVSDTLLVITLAFVALAAAVKFGLHVSWLAVLLVLVALATLTLRWLVVALLRRFTDATRYRPVASKLRELVDDTSKDVRRELRRLGLPSHVLTLPLLAFRLIGRRRRETVEKLRRFETDRVVPTARLDELHMLLRTGDPGLRGGPTG